MPLGFYGTGKLGMGDTVIGPNGLPITVAPQPTAASSTTSDCVNGYDSYGNACQDFSSITSSPAATSAAINYLYTPAVAPTTPPVASSSTTTYMIAATVAVGFLLLLMKR